MIIICLSCSVIFVGMAIFDTMRHIRPDVSTVCVGLAARYLILDLFRPFLASLGDFHVKLISMLDLMRHLLFSLTVWGLSFLALVPKVKQLSWFMTSDLILVHHLTFAKCLSSWCIDN